MQKAIEGVSSEIRPPNEETILAIKELEQGGGEKFSSFEAMIDELEKDDDA